IDTRVVEGARDRQLRLEPAGSGDSCIANEWREYPQIDAAVRENRRLAVGKPHLAIHVQCRALTGPLPLRDACEAIARNDSRRHPLRHGQVRNPEIEPVEARLTSDVGQLERGWLERTGCVDSADDLRARGWCNERRENVRGDRRGARGKRGGTLNPRERGEETRR